MTLNKGQQSCFIDVINFINDPNQQFMDISGGAGTGKTYFIGQIADGILRHKNKDCPLHTVSITATTNKAAAVIAEAMPHRAIDIKTIYSFMNLRVKENFKTGEVSLIPTPKWAIHSGTLIIVDEDSMIDSKLFSYLQKGIDKTCKVLFVGDRNQLSPVTETLSPIFTQGYKTSFLTQPVRNAEQPALMELCEQVKQTVLTGVFTPIKEVPGVIDFVDGIGLQGYLERNFHTESTGKRVLSYTNQRVIEYNNYIRSLRGYTKPYVVGEIISNNSAVELMGKEKLYTDQTVQIVEVSPTIKDDKIIKGHEFEVADLTVQDVTTKHVYHVSCFWNSNDRRDVLQYYYKNKIWDKYFKTKNLFPDLRAISASTTHKAQGSTYNSVVVDLADIGKCTNRDQTARLQYVALSRPKNHIVIRGKLPNRYFQ